MSSLSTGSQNQKNTISSRTCRITNIVLVGCGRFDASHRHGRHAEVPRPAKLGRLSGRHYQSGRHCQRNGRIRIGDSRRVVGVSALRRTGECSFPRDGRKYRRRPTRRRGGTQAAAHDGVVILVVVAGQANPLCRREPHWPATGVVAGQRRTNLFCRTCPQCTPGGTGQWAAA